MIILDLSEEEDELEETFCENITEALKKKRHGFLGKCDGRSLGPISHGLVS